MTGITRSLRRNPKAGSGFRHDDLLKWSGPVLVKVSNLQFFF